VLPAGWRSYTFWQYSRWGSVPGITGSATDQDALAAVPHGSKPLVQAQLKFLISLNGGA
jgi:GH25 family lysozyme M1 (1,4-beta-N-acetylmuramidase)